MQKEYTPNSIQQINKFFLKLRSLFSLQQRLQEKLKLPYKPFYLTLPSFFICLISTFSMLFLTQDFFKESETLSLSLTTLLFNSFFLPLIAFPSVFFGSIFISNNVAFFAKKLFFKYFLSKINKLINNLVADKELILVYFIHLGFSELSEDDQDVIYQCLFNNYYTHKFWDITFKLIENKNKISSSDNVEQMKNFVANYQQSESFPMKQFINK